MRNKSDKVRRTIKANITGEKDNIRLFGALFRLVRWKNLLIIILTQVLLQYFLIIPFAEIAGASFISMSGLNFAILIISTILITAAGYIINDHFDVEIDIINKPERVIIGRFISKKQGLYLYWILNIIGVAAGFHVAHRVSALSLGFIFPVTAGLLWMYSLQYKRMVLIGNLVVSLLSAMPVLLVWLFNFFLTKAQNPEFLVSAKSINTIINVSVWFYAIFAFVVTLIREIIKDIEDIDGDSAAGCQTLPLTLGIKVTKNIIFILIVFSITVLAFAQYLMLTHDFRILFFYYLITVQGLFFYLLTLTLHSRTTKDFRFAGNIAKIVMVAGLLGIQLFKLEIIFLQ